MLGRKDAIVVGGAALRQGRRGESAAAAIHVAMTVDAAYLWHAAVAAHSFMRHAAPDDSYVLHLVVAAKDRAAALEVAARLEQAHPALACEIAHVPAEVEDAFERSSATNHLPASSFARLALPDALPGADRVIYLDADVSVCGDLAELWGVELGGSLIAGVPESFTGERGAFQDDHQRRLGFAYDDSYVDSGVLVMDLAALRDERLRGRIWAELGRDLPFGDMDVLNAVCRGRILVLPLRFNVVCRELVEGQLRERACYPSHEIDEVLRGNVLVLHYLGRETKPWDYLQLRWSERWHEDARDILPAEELRRVEDRARAYWRSFDLADLMGRCRAASGVWVYGFTAASRGLADLLAASGTCAVRGFFDRDPNKLGRMHGGAACCDPGEMPELVGKDDLLVVATQKNYFPVRKELRRLGLEPAHVDRYQRKDANYYAQLMPSAHGEELDALRRVLAADARAERASLGALSCDALARELREGSHEDLEEEFCLRSWLLAERGEEGSWTSMS